MKLLRRMGRMVGAFLAIIMMMVSIQAPAYASMVGTGEVIAQAKAGLDRASILSALERGEVQAQLRALGVDPEAAKARVAALSDDEVQSVAAKLDELPAGGDVLGVVVFLFLVLLVTDILGFTNVFPFVKKTVR